MFVDQTNHRNPKILKRLILKREIRIERILPPRPRSSHTQCTRCGCFLSRSSKTMTCNSPPQWLQSCTKLPSIVPCTVELVCVLMVLWYAYMRKQYIYVTIHHISSAGKNPYCMDSICYTSCSVSADRVVMLYSWDYHDLIFLPTLYCVSRLNISIVLNGMLNLNSQMVW